MRPWLHTVALAALLTGSLGGLWLLHQRRELRLAELQQKEQQQQQEQVSAALDAQTVADPNFTNLSALLGALEKAERFTLFEGLPHPRFESKQLATELARQKHRQRNGYPFYIEPLELTPATLASSLALLRDPSLYTPWNGEKLCGGFHPDYALQFFARGQLYRLLICFGCFEVKLFGGGVTLRSSLALEPGQKLKEALASCQKNRPPWRLDNWDLKSLLKPGFKGTDAP